MVPSPLKWRVLLAGYFALLLYEVSISPRHLKWWMVPTPVNGKLNPFTFAPSSTSASDIAANLAAFFLLGWLIGLSAPGARGPWRSAVIAALLGGGFSAVVEYYQQWIPGRVSSGLDIVFDTLGAVMGGMLADRLRKRIEALVDGAVSGSRGIGWPAAWYVVFVVVLSLWPWRIGVSLGEVYAGLRRAELDPLATGSGGWRALAWGAARAWGMFVPLGLLIARHARASLRLGHVLTAGLLIAGGIELLQLLSPDHICSTWQAVAGAAGALSGAGGAILSRRLEGPEKRSADQTPAA